ncbi:hypothetical protein AA313_de0201899 [Arthrobotrys entomopaga]|nr:hypothetical protein AA313_de0201899 [Arthrobotrys entomopaga]
MEISLTLVEKRTPVSPKPPNLGIADDGRFHRISPVPSGPNTPVINPSTSLARSNKTRNGPLGGKQHTRTASKLREITSQLHLPESMTSSPVTSAVTNSTESLQSTESTAGMAQATTDSSSGDNLSPSSEDEGPLVPVRTHSSSLILRPKGQSLPSSAERKNGVAGRRGIRGDDIKSIMITTDSKPPALTAPPTPIRSGVARWLVLSPQGWLVVKILLFFFKVVSVVNRCSPVAPNPWLFNSLLLFALADLFGYVLNYLTPLRPNLDSECA